MTERVQVSSQSGVPLQLPDNSSVKYRQAVTPIRCYWCEDAFGLGQTRFPIFDGVDFGSGWELVPVCMRCFKAAGADHTSNLKRSVGSCQGCGEPILSPNEGRFRFRVCSHRCYQRAYRKRRRTNGGSTIDWKGTHRVCEACKADVTAQRKDARFCSNRCRQWAYRRQQLEVCHG